MQQEIEILKVIMDSHPEMAFHDSLKYMGKASKYIANLRADIAKGNTSTGDQDVESTDSTEGQKRGHVYTKADLKVNPVAALKGEKATCCLCGKGFDFISKTHLWSSHEITPEQYRELCGYSPETKLMTDACLQKKKDVLKAAEPWKKTNHWIEKQAREAAAKAADESSPAEQPTPKENSADPKSDAKPQAQASAKPEKKDGKRDNAPKS